MSGPFRWDMARREQLGTWLGQLPDPPTLIPEGVAELRKTAVELLATSEGARLAFVGRTPENWFDDLSGALKGLAEAPELHLVQFSMRAPPGGTVAAIPPPQFGALTDYFRTLGVHPDDIASGPAPLAWVDFVASGGTMKALCQVLHRMAVEAGQDWGAVQRRLMLIGLVTRTKNSPNTRRWQQKQDWLDLVPDAVIRNISVDPEFLLELANAQEKATPSFHLGRWGEGEGRRFAPSEAMLTAMSRAVQLHDLGATRDERRHLARLIAANRRMRHPAVRALARALKG